MVSLRVMLVPIEAMEVAFIMVVRGGGEVAMAPAVVKDFMLGR